MIELKIISDEFTGTTVTGIKTIKERETLKERGKKKFIERVIETEEAEQAIKEYKKEKEDYDEPEQPIPNFIR